MLTTKLKEGAEMDTLFTRRDVLKAGAAAGLVYALPVGGLAQEKGASADLILTNGRIATLDKRKPAATAVAISGGKFVAVGGEVTEDARSMRPKINAMPVVAQSKVNDLLGPPLRGQIAHRKRRVGRADRAADAG